MRLLPRSIQALFAVATIALTTAHASVTVGNSNVQIGGFFSQGYLKSAKNNYPFEAKDGTWDFREMAVNVSTTVGSHTRLGAQGFAQRLGNYGEDKVILDWAVADYNFRPEFGIRAGRIKFPKGLYGEALDLDALRPFIFLPGGIYNPVMRDFAASFDGVMLYGSLSTAKSGTFDYKVFYGDIALSTDQGVADFLTDTGLFAAPGVKSLSLDHTKGVSVDWTTPVTGLKVHVSYSKLVHFQGRGQFAAAPVLPVLIDVSLNYKNIGLEYLHNDWTFAVEWQEQSGDSLVLAAPAYTSSGDYGSRYYYGSIARRVGEKWEFGAYFSKTKNLFPVAGTPKAQNHLDDFALSVRHNVNEHVILKAEYHFIDGRQNMFNTARTPNPTKSDTMSYWAVKSTFVF